MLDNKETVFEVGKIVAIRISTGDEVIGEITNMDKESISLKKPCGLQLNQTTGEVILAPATMLGDPEKPIAYQRGSIVARMTPRADALESYKAYASDIALVKKDGLVLPK
jgi:hypothetical protein